ncbi:MAG TPA: dienelactone hydrolase family protein [Gammaproteobacteria bacterium]
MPFGGEVEIRTRGAVLQGDLQVPEGASGIVIFAHGSGSSRFSPRNRSVARYLRERHLGTLLFDLLTADEERADRATARYRFDIGFLAPRLAAVAEWLERERPGTALGYFGASTGAAAALVAAAEAPHTIRAVVSRGGRPDLAGDALERVRAPTLLIVGGEDHQVLRLNEHALASLRCEKELVVVPGATHLFEEPGALDEVARHAAGWFEAHFLQA